VAGPSRYRVGIALASREIPETFKEGKGLIDGMGGKIKVEFVGVLYWQGVALALSRWSS
jgi:hypothetical protein